MLSIILLLTDYIVLAYATVLMSTFMNICVACIFSSHFLCKISYFMKNILLDFLQ